MTTPEEIFTGQIGSYLPAGHFVVHTSGSNIVCVIQDAMAKIKAQSGYEKGYQHVVGWEEDWDISPYVNPDTYRYLVQDEVFSDEPAFNSKRLLVTLFGGHHLQFGWTNPMMSHPSIDEIIDTEIVHAIRKGVRNGQVKFSPQMKALFWQKIQTSGGFLGFGPSPLSSWTPQEKTDDKNWIDGETVVTGLISVIPALATFETTCPVAGCDAYKHPRLLTRLIPHLNDNKHRWSREQIADWLDTLDVDLDFQDPNPEF